MATIIPEIHIAYHEVGHWIAADELGIQTCDISIISHDDGSAGRVKIEDGDDFCVPQGTDPYSPANELSFHKWAMEQAIIDYAGHAAVVALMGICDMSDESAVDNGAGPDFQDANERLGNNDLRILEAKNRAIQIVTTRQQDAELIVDILLRVKRLDSQQVDLLLGGAGAFFLNEDGSFRD